MSTPSAPDAHISVLLHETVDELLANRTSGVFVDATFGRGGHTRALLSKLDANSRVIAFDKDPRAQAVGAELMAIDPRLTLIHDSFANIKSALTALGITQVDGVMADFGVSSPQLDDASRGFSFMNDGPLDMRMDNSQGITASEWLMTVSEEELANAIYKYGEERYSRRIAKAIKDALPITTTGVLAEVVKVAHPKWDKHKHPATRTFQGIRIAMNHELDDIEQFLPDAVSMLNSGCRLAVISFHSLEDRIVKQYLQKASSEALNDLGWAIPGSEGQKVLKKVSRIAPSDAEVKENPRSRSAWLRVGEKL